LIEFAAPVSRRISIRASVGQYNSNTFEELLISRTAAAIIVIVVPMFLLAFYVQSYLVQGLAESGVEE
jgi:ABC-type maltose transport system permease subunit